MGHVASGWDLLEVHEEKSLDDVERVGWERVTIVDGDLLRWLVSDVVESVFQDKVHVLHGICGEWLLVGKDEGIPGLSSYINAADHYKK